MILKRGLLTIILLLALTMGASAQFYPSGADPAGVRWYQIKSPDYRIIYPEGLDSLALLYGRGLEAVKVPVGRSVGYEPNEAYRRPMPVVLHPFTAVANGSVAWTPRHMELYTGPDASAPDPMEWMTNLTIHESRHVAQMQFARDRGYGIFNWLVGEMFPGAMSALYPGPALFEGDAVVAETALTSMGRGRSADFLEYYRVSFAEGDFRDWYVWRWGSQKKYTPDYYRAGYMLVGGVRFDYDAPLFADRYYDLLHERRMPLPLFNLQRTVKDVSGRSLRDAWREIAAGRQLEWALDEAARAPFDDAKPLTAPDRRFSEYTRTVMAGDRILAVKTGMTASPRLVSVGRDGEVSVLRPFASSAGDLRYSGALDRVFWSETVQDPRWEMKSSSRIRSMNPDGKDVVTLTREGRLFNPAPSPVDSRVSVTEYPDFGGSAVLVLDGESGAELARYRAPDSLQVVETAWVDGRIVASGISPSGFGLYDASGGFAMLLAPTRAKIKQLESDGDKLYFVSDRLSVNELYRLQGGELKRMSNNRFGGSDFVVEAGTDSVTFAALTTGGRMLYRAAVKPVDEDTDRLYDYPMADGLSRQEAGLVRPDEAKPGEFSAPSRYRKLPHLIKVHSWAPVFVDSDAIASASFEQITASAGLGASVFFQNDLGTSYGEIGYHASYFKEDLKIPYWRHSGMLKYTYSGLYPVIELTGRFGERDAERYGFLVTKYAHSNAMSMISSTADSPSVSGTARIYIPWTFSEGGWLRGLVPQVSLSLTNDVVNTSDLYRVYRESIGEKIEGLTSFDHAVPGKSVPMGRATASLRGYSMLSRAEAGIYPRWGLGLEAGASMRPGLADLFSPSYYAFAYGYVPGFLDTHGVKLTATGVFVSQKRVADIAVRTLPRGFGGSSKAQSYLQARYPFHTTLTLDYALPFLPVDWSFAGPLAYIRNFEFTAHGDCAVYSGAENYSTGSLYSIGADLCVRLSNLAWIPYDTRIGVSYNYNGGSLWDAMTKVNIPLDRHCVSMILSVDL